MKKDINTENRKLTKDEDILILKSKTFWADMAREGILQQAAEMTEEEALQELQRLEEEYKKNLDII